MPGQALVEMRRLARVAARGGAARPALAPQAGSRPPGRASDEHASRRPGGRRRPRRRLAGVELAAGVDLTAYRIVQEALTNAFTTRGERTNRRASPSVTGNGSIELEIGRRREAVLAGGGAARATGCVGMREHVALYGGEFTVGPRPEGGYRVWGGRLPGGAGSVVIRVLLADDQPLVRDGLRAILEAQDDIEVVGDAANGRAKPCRTRARAMSPDLAVIDIRMPELDGLEATRRLMREPGPAARPGSSRPSTLTSTSTRR